MKPMKGRTVAEFYQGARVRQVGAPELPDQARRQALLVAQFGRMGTVDFVMHTVVFVRWDDGSQGSWYPEHLELLR